MPVKKAAVKRKVTQVSDNVVAPPAKVGRRGHSIGRVQEVFVATRSSHREPGQVLTLGQGDVGQLGLGPDIMERGRPTVVPGHTDIVDICAGGMHTICLSNAGKVITFGCNDEGALGRPTSEEGSETTPGTVALEGVVVQISAGDSHSAALLEDGRVFAWGAFRDSHGTMGLLSGEIKKEPTLINVPDKVTMITSGADHLLLLTKQGLVYSCGCGEQGQLGRLSGRVASRESRQGLNQLLVPAPVTFSKFKHPCDRIWAGSYSTYARESQTGKIAVFGLNNYSQLAIKNSGENVNSHFHPVLSRPFSDNKKWEKICGGQHHTLALDSDGLVYALGRSEYGRLGLGGGTDSDVATPTIIPALKDKKCVDISCGSCVSFAVTDDGSVYAWGMGTNGQLGTGDEDDQLEPVKMGGKQLEGRKVVAVSGGGQHTVLLGVSSTSSSDAMDQS